VVSEIKPVVVDDCASGKLEAREPFQSILKNFNIGSEIST
jgi:hypothetical protein